MNWIVVIARNNLSLTKKAVASFIKQDIPVSILVVNNASTDGTAEWLHGQPVYTIHYQSQKSVAECWNRALRFCFRDGAERVLVCNSDVEIGPETYSYLSAFCEYKEGAESLGLRKDRPAFVTCVGVNTDKQNQHPAINWSYHIRPHPDFSCFMITKGVFDEVGPFDEEMKIAYCEDSDYHVRMHRAGIKAVCVDIPFLHHGAATVKQAEPEEAQRIREQADRNRERFYQKYGARIGTPEYEALFTPETFGIESKPSQ